MSALDLWQAIDSAPSYTRILVRDSDGDVYRAAFEPDLDGARIWRAYCGQPVVQPPEPVEWSPVLSHLIDQSRAPGS